MKPRAALLVPTLIHLTLLLATPPHVRCSPAPASAQGYNATVYDASAARCARCVGGGDNALGVWAESLEFLYYHNLVRMARWELLLAWSARMEAYARWWAAQRRGDCALRHSFPEGQFALGENIFWAAPEGNAAFSFGSPWARARP